MATLKDLIKTETLKVGATSCAPSGSVVDLAGILRDGNTEYVLPESGYVSLCAPSPINTWAGLSCNEIASQARSDATDSWVTHHIYGKKGDVVKITVDKVSRIGWVRFVKAIGGGYKRYLKALSCNRFGGSLWLCLKTIYAVSESKSSTLACRTTTRKSFSQAGQKNTQHRLTGLRMLGISSPRQDPSQSTLAHQVAAWYSWQEHNKMWEGIRGGIQSISDSLKDNGIALRLQKVPQKNQQLLIADSTLTSANNARMEVAA